VEDGSGRTIYGSSYDENSFQLDGVDITDNYFNEYQPRRTRTRSRRWRCSPRRASSTANPTGAVYNTSPVGRTSTTAT
jgi:hypothetical protein